MVWTRERNVFGFLVGVSVTAPTEQVSMGLDARMRHYLERALRCICRMVAWHVAEVPRRYAVLRRMPLEDAQALGLEKEWKQAADETEAAS